VKKRAVEDRDKRVDPVGEADLESFPASDPPAWTLAPPDWVKAEEEKARRAVRARVDGVGKLARASPAPPANRP
jgi:hypothetical protein